MGPSIRRVDRLGVERRVSFISVPIPFLRRDEFRRRIEDKEGRVSVEPSSHPRCLSRPVLPSLFPKRVNLFFLSRFLDCGLNSEKFLFSKRGFHFLILCLGHRYVRV